MKLKKVSKKGRKELLEGEVVYIDGVELIVTNNCKTHDNLIFFEFDPKDVKNIKNDSLKHRINKKDKNSEQYYVDEFPYVDDKKKWTFLTNTEECEIYIPIPEKEEEKILQEIRKSIVSIKSKL